VRDLDEVSGIIVDSALGVHRALGPGLLESVYELVLARVLVRRGLSVDRQHAVSFEYDGLWFDSAFRIDLLVEECVAVELKSVERRSALHAKQLLTYLRLADLRVGLLLNFGEERLKDGLRRVVNDLPPSASPRLRVNRS
jgi:GxxExxY protein